MFNGLLAAVYIPILQCLPLRRLRMKNCNSLLWEYLTVKVT
jgi:hypothetical protein